MLVWNNFIVSQQIEEGRRLRQVAECRAKRHTGSGQLGPRRIEQMVGKPVNSRWQSARGCATVTEIGQPVCIANELYTWGP